MLVGWPISRTWRTWWTARLRAGSSTLLVPMLDMLLQHVLLAWPHLGLIDWRDTRTAAAWPCSSPLGPDTGMQNAISTRGQHQTHLDLLRAFLFLLVSSRFGLPSFCSVRFFPCCAPPSRPDTKDDLGAALNTGRRVVERQCVESEKTFLASTPPFSAHQFVWHLRAATVRQ